MRRIAGRRLVRLLEPAPRNLHPNKVVLFVQEEVTADDLDTVVDLLIELCERGRHFTIVTEPSDAGLDPSQGGVGSFFVAAVEGRDVAVSLAIWREVTEGWDVVSS